jgi:hypothetical protein
MPKNPDIFVFYTSAASGGRSGPRWLCAFGIATNSRIGSCGGTREIIFNGEKLDMEAVSKVGDGFFSPAQRK